MRFKRMIIGIILIVIGIVIDQFTKILVFRNLELNHEYSSIPGFKLYPITNPGAAWGMFANKMWLLILITFVAFGFFVYLMKDFDLKENPIYSASLILIVSGTFGNFIDRIFLGYVRDFIKFSFWESFPIFNIADICLTIGVLFLSFDILFGETGVRWTK